MKLTEKKCPIYIHILVFVVSSYLLKATAQNPDSIYKRALNSKDISFGITLCKQVYKVGKLKNNNVIVIKATNLASEYFWDKSMYDSAKVYAEYSLKLGKLYHIDSLQAKAIAILALIDYNGNKFEKAISEFKESAHLYKIKKDNLNEAINWKNVGVCERKISENEEAISCFFKAIKTFQALNDLNNLSACYNSIALCFVSLKQFPKALSYNKASLLIRLSLKDSSKIAQSYNNIGFSFKENNQIDSAITNFLKSIALYKKLANSDGSLVLPYQNLASCYKAKLNLSLAKRYIRMSLDIAVNLKMKEEMARGNLDLCEILMEEKKYAPALTAVNITEAVATELKLPELLMQADDDKYKVYQQMGNYKEALYYETQKENLKDSIFP